MSKHSGAGCIGINNDPFSIQRQQQRNGGQTVYFQYDDNKIYFLSSSNNNYYYDNQSSLLRTFHLRFLNVEEKYGNNNLTMTVM